MQMRLSQNELATKCTQALKALDFAPGLAIANGRNIGWLAAHGLPSLQLLVEEIEAVSGSRPRSMETTIATDSVEFHGCCISCFDIAQSAVDFAEIGKHVRIKRCRSPLLIFAEMASREHLPYGFILQWRRFGKIHRGCSRSGQSEITDSLAELTASYDVRLTASKDIVIKRPIKPLGRLKCLRDTSILINSDQWNAVCSIARMALVPDSGQSRNRAGSKVDDNT